jgi:putative methionine-R-sulfoxide reductase with GAF domain
MLPKLEITYKEDFITFEFLALDYNMPEKISYAYKLEGFDKEWIYCGDKREATYTNLNPGNYVFCVKASNNDGLWNEDGIKLKLYIQPPWWETIWFRVLAGISIFVIVFSAYRLRVAQLKRNQRILETKVALRTAELKTANEEIMQQNEELNQANEEINTKNHHLEEQKEELRLKNLEIENQKSEVEKAFKNSQVLSEFGQKITASLNIFEINAMLYEYVSNLMDTAAFGIGLYNVNVNALEYHSFMENGKKLPYFIKKLDSKNSFTAWCFNNQKIVFINNIEEEFNKYISTLPQVQTNEIPRSLIHIPLTVEDKKIGIIALNSFKKNAYSQRDLTNLQTIASYLSIALDNANAYQLIEQQHEHIKSSIRYAENIQKSILPLKENMNKYINSFVLFYPRDIVSGDFYWFTTVTIDNEQLSINNEQLSMNNEQLSMNNYQLTMNNYQLTMNNYQLTMNNYQLTMNNYQLTMKNVLN